MVNPFNYLFYKIYTFLSHLSGGGNPMTQTGAMGIILVMNVFTICMLITNDLSKKFMITSGIVVGLIMLLYAIPKISEKIISKYEKESDKSRLIGNTVVAFYVILSIVSFIVISRNTFKC